MKRSKPCSITDYDEAVAAGIIGEPPSSEQCLHEFVTIDSAGQLACRWCAKLFNFRLAGLGDLLAVIHGDGGHYLAEHGPEKAVADAIDKYNRLLVELDHMQYVYRKRTQDAEQTVDDDAPDASEQLRTSNPRAHLGWHIVDRLRREGGTITWADGRVEVVAADVATVKHEGT